MEDLSKDDLKRRWRISTSTLDRIRRGGDLPEVDTKCRPGPGRRVVRFALDAVREWEQRHRDWLARVFLRHKGEGDRRAGQPPQEENS